MGKISSIGITPNKHPAGSINHIIDHFGTNGVQRANRYTVQFINCPVNGFDQSTFFATMVQVPQRTINYFSDSVGPFSPYWDVPLKEEYDDHFIINFVVDSNWNIRRLIESWMSQVTGGPLSSGSGWAPGYIYGRSARYANIQADSMNENFSQVIIKGIGTDNNQKATITLNQAWPKLILPSQFDTNALNQPLLLSVDFSYRYYIIT